MEEKERFYAQYWNQKVLMSLENNQSFGMIDFVDYNTMLTVKNGWDCCLLLKSLEDITDEDAVEVAKMLFPSIKDHWSVHRNSEHTHVRSWGRVLRVINFERNMILGNHLESVFDVCDFEKVTYYLRSKGYLLPFNGKSVEEIKKLEWAKTKEN